jgi:hypothetical protein
MTKSEKRMSETPYDLRLVIHNKKECAAVERTKEKGARIKVGGNTK